MNPVVGLEVAKGESQVKAFLDKKMPYKSSFKVSHTIEGLETLLHFLIEIEDKTGVKPPIVVESTGHYHTPVVQFFEANQQTVTSSESCRLVRSKEETYKPRK
jgi:transposase